MNKTFIYIVIIVLFFGCKNETKDFSSKLSTYVEINELIKQVIKADTTKSMIESNNELIRVEINAKGDTIESKVKSNTIFYYLYSSSGIFRLKDINDLVKLTNDDMKLMSLQDSIFYHAQLHSGIFNEYKLVNRDTKSRGGRFRTFSVPLLTLDKKYLFIIMGYDVGFLSGRTYFVIFENVENKWIEKHRSLLYIS